MWLDVECGDENLAAKSSGGSALLGKSIVEL